MANDDHDNAETDREMFDQIDGDLRRARERDAEQRFVREELEKGLVSLHIPHHMHAAIRTHVNDRRPVGDFLTALLENNLKESVIRADHINLAALVDWCRLLYNFVPSACQGSPAKVKAWLEGDKDEVPTAD